MANKTKSLALWCKDNNNEEILMQWEYDLNVYGDKQISIDKIPYNSSFNSHWKCQKGHLWTGTVIGRTKFNLGCPICEPLKSVLAVGTRYGCLTIIGDYLVYKEKRKEKIDRLKEDIELLEHKLGQSTEDSERYHIESVIKRIDTIICDIQNTDRYLCRCKCGLEHFLSEQEFLSKRHRYCTELTKVLRRIPECGLIKQHSDKMIASYNRVPAENYDIDFTGTIHELLAILKCTDEHLERLKSWTDKRKKGGGTFKVYKLYKCQCYLCGKEYTFDCEQLSINPPSKYGIHAYNGYYSEAYCDCHKILLFQWIVNKLLIENNIPYRVEQAFEGLLGVDKINLLRYDFAILNPDNTIKCLIECQGEQHYEPVEKFGGEHSFRKQQQNDELKRKYADNIGVKLLEISYKDKKIDKIKEILKMNGII